MHSNSSFILVYGGFMARFADVFPGKSLLVVIHATVDLAHVLRNISIALDNGAHGVFLINHGFSALELRRIYLSARTQFPQAWIGLNFLDLDRSAGLQSLPFSVSGFWTDNAGVFDTNIRDAVTFWDQWKHRELDALYFGGVAFKYQNHVQDISGTAVLAAPFMDVVVTSGDQTGTPPSVEKIKMMREALHDHPFAIASGISVRNINDFLPYADCFLVATSVSTSFTELDPLKVGELARVIRG